MGKGFRDRTRSALEQVHIRGAASKRTRINVVLVKQFQVKIAEVRRFFENGMGLVAIAAPGQDHGKVVAGVIGCVSEITAHHHGCVVEQGAVTFLNPVHLEKKAVEVLEGVDLDLAQAFDFFGLASMM